MANIVANNTENAAREAWLSFLRGHPKVSGFLAIISSFFGYFLNGHAIVAFVQWLVRVAGRVAESALLLATLYVTLNNVAHTLVTWILPSQAISALNYLSLVAFSLLPELIVAAAIKITVDHWSMLMRNRSWRNPAWIWAVLYSLPTLTFVVMTIYTLLGFVQIVAISGTPAQATGASLTIRFLAGWSYAMIEILFATIGKKSYVALLDSLRSMIATQGNELSVALRKIATHDTDANVLRVTSATQEGNIKALWIAMQEAGSTLENMSNTLAQRDRTIGELGEEIATQDEEIADLRATVARLKQQKALRRVAPPSQEIATQSATVAQSHSDHSATDNGYVAIDNGDSIAISDGKGATLIATGEPRDRIKQAMLIALQNSEKINYREIAEMAQAGYSTVRKHAQSIIEEIEKETTGEHTIVSIG